MTYEEILETGKEVLIRVESRQVKTRNGSRKPPKEEGLTEREGKVTSPISGRQDLKSALHLSTRPQRFYRQKRLYQLTAESSPDTKINPPRVDGIKIAQVNSGQDRVLQKHRLIPVELQITDKRKIAQIEGTQDLQVRGKNLANESMSSAKHTWKQIPIQQAYFQQ